MPLSERERDLLEFERTWWTGSVPKAEAIEERFGLTAEHYDRLLASLADVPEALEHDPLVVRRLQRARTRRLVARSARPVGRDLAR